MRAWPRQLVRFHYAAAVAVGVVVALGAAAVGGHPAGALLGVVVAAGYAGSATRRYRRRRALLEAPMDEAWRRILEQRVAYYRRLDEAGQARFENDVRIFLAEQNVTGAGEHEVDDATRILIAASAAMLTNGTPDFEWPNLRDIVVYPQAFDDDYHLSEDARVAGQVHRQGPIIYSARDLKLGFRREEGHNVGLHELAHVLDLQDGHADGIPVDADFTADAPWVGVVTDRLRRLRKGRPSPLRDYGAINEAELFAVAVEAFFEKPDELARRDPELFDLLHDYFQQDPRG